ncbi:hypothetical protein GLAREA_01267 [Glarea lozoyensis ATCC 20868]|uniref:F-box domain-containing protein n=1 Tax=Glarea lozoyensis (strain ATCC 20868 / MF5171) TaxID=1116229 RepID=S3CHN2_GLAL2|nr:uncharacterized protein GLAREA_01267 [Glarea lozoyensis ATCC 20868]EPE25355.1 hypothetical protein GLAREA_01267 [Glarea lozoyensis ATCC 20868]
MDKMRKVLHEDSRPKLALESLPAELKVIIFFALPDLISLKHIASTSRSLYNAVKSAERHVVHPFLSSELEFDVLPEAAAVIASSRIKSRTKSQMLTFAENHLRCPWHWDPKFYFTLADALYISKLHKQIQSFTNQFFVVAFMDDHEILDPAPLSRNETARIMRAFYRFEIYCNLFRYKQEQQNYTAKEQQELFFSWFSPWDNEQLACVEMFFSLTHGNFLADIVASENMAPQSKVNSYLGPNGERFQHFLSLGLDYLHQFDTAGSLEEQKALMYPHLNLENGDFLHSGLEAVNKPHDGVLLKNYIFSPSGELEGPGWPVHFRDDDYGPHVAWIGSHLNFSCDRLIWGCDLHQLYDQGYVMRDFIRLQSLNIDYDCGQEIIDAREIHMARMSGSEQG